ncbi:hypothetical protein [Roseovarius sp. MMSF_3281]|uniref:DUF6902 family protein n=1 Tax=Roseovarius sp. MMSF_3281 TaxID=3046694 RepID=UPI00273D8020|nr:hypothetical protein [Roseovarius sp. MMSF_3281]
MDNVVQLDVPFRQNSMAARQAAMLDVFARERRFDGDVFWLKENAEALNVLESSGAVLPEGALEVHRAFYDEIERRMGFFPQYYRFFLGLCLDLEDLGIGGNKGEGLARWVAQQGLPRAELSDLQRAEARRLCLRRGVDPVAEDEGLTDRLRGFAQRSETFTLPNKKAAYELTHIVFYLSEYGRRDPQVGKDFIDSLHFAGTLAFLELNLDLLAEICIALRFAGDTPPEVWERWLRDQAGLFRLEAVPGQGAPQDDYHPWLVVNWAMQVAGQGGFAQQIPEGRVVFRQPSPAAGPLRELSDCIYRMEGARSADWHKMRDRVQEALSEEARRVLLAAEAATDRFEAFFAGFARTGMQQAAL